MIKKFDAEKVGRILLQKELDLQEAHDGEEIWKSLYHDKNNDIEKLTIENEQLKSTFNKLREEIRTMSKYKDAFDEVMSYVKNLEQVDQKAIYDYVKKINLYDEKENR